MSTQPVADAVTLLSALGLAPTASTLSSVRPFRLSTIQEVALARAVLASTSGLTWQQFAENPWGFPSMPYPADRNGARDGRLLLSPSTVSYQWMGHPIFWVDPALSQPTEVERDDPARWCVRMFYVIMALGLWDVREDSTTPLAWYDAPRTAGVDYTESDHQAYLSGDSSALDPVRYTAEDLLVSIERIERQTQAALDNVGRIQIRAWRAMRAEQGVAADQAVVLLSSDEGSPYGIAGGAVRSLSSQLAAAVSSKTDVQSLVAPLYEAVNAVVDILNRMERAVLVLTASTVVSASDDPAVLARLASDLELYEDRVVEGLHSEELYAITDALFRTAAIDARDFATLTERVEQLYTDAWRRLTLASVNFARMSKGMSPYPDYLALELDASLAGQG